MERATAAVQERSPGLSEENYKQLNTTRCCRTLLPGSGPDVPEEELDAVGRVASHRPQRNAEGAESTNHQELMEPAEAGGIARRAEILSGELLRSPWARSSSGLSS